MSKQVSDKVNTPVSSESLITNPCPIRDVLDRIGDQWSLLVLTTLEDRTVRFNALLREIGDVSKQMLSRTLKQLEQDGYVTRTIYAEVPPRVEYCLTELGYSLLQTAQQLIDWAKTHHNQICLARREYEQRNQALMQNKD